MSDIEKTKETKEEPGAVSLDSSQDADLDAYEGISEKKLLAKLDLHLLPAVGVLYLLSFLDRSNVGNAKLDGLTTDINMTDNEYLTGLTLFFIGYILFEVPCQIVLKRTTPKFWLPTLTVIWGINATLLGVVQNTAGFFVARFTLGITEGGLFPGVVYYLSMWYKRQERQYRVALFFSAASLAGAFGGILAYGIGKMAGVAGQAGWRWIFIIEGCATTAIALLAYLFITNYPDSARWLSSTEKSYIQRRLKLDSDSSNNESFLWSNVVSALKDPKCWLYAAAFHTLSLPLYTLSLFLPTIIEALGYEAADAQLLTVPPYALATILTFTLAVISERVQLRAPFIMGTSTLAAIGYIILLTNAQQLTRPGVSYVGLFFCAAGIYPSTALALSWPAVNVSGQTKRATAAGMQISIGNLGAVIGTQLYRSSTSPRYFLGHGVALAYVTLNVIVSGVTWWYLTRENKRREAIAGPEVVATPGTEKDWPGDVDPRWRFTV